MKKQSAILVLTSLLVVVNSQLLLNGVPLEFELGGTVNYTPTSGGINIPGYILEIGYTRHQWIGLKFMTLTSTSNFDVLIIKRATTSNAGVYQSTVSDYYIASGRPNTLMTDTINNMDKQVTSSSDSNHFHLQIYRTRGKTNGEDWEGGDFLKICFFTSDSIFNKDKWFAQYQSCYGFAIQQYKSRWLGFQIIPSALFDTVNSQIYGGFSGPTLRLELFIFRPKVNLTGDELTIRIGDQINSRVGYDYHKCILNPGDYYGNSSSSLKKDLLFSGYDDTSCTVSKSSSYLLVHFSRFVNTYDQFDKVITRITNFCFTVGLNQNCYIIQGKVLFPQMNVESSIKIFGDRLSFTIGLLILIIFSL